jgi:hypothetical protein
MNNGFKSRLMFFNQSTTLKISAEQECSFFFIIVIMWLKCSTITAVSLSITTQIIMRVNYYSQLEFNPNGQIILWAIQFVHFCDILQTQLTNSIREA